MKPVAFIFLLLFPPSVFHKESKRRKTPMSCCHCMRKSRTQRWIESVMWNRTVNGENSFQLLRSDSFIRFFFFLSSCRRWRSFFRVGRLWKWSMNGHLECSINSPLALLPPRSCKYIGRYGWRRTVLPNGRSQHSQCWPINFRNLSWNLLNVSFPVRYKLPYPCVHFTAIATHSVVWSCFVWHING